MEESMEGDIFITTNDRIRDKNQVLEPKYSKELMGVCQNTYGDTEQHIRSIQGKSTNGIT